MLAWYEPALEAPTVMEKSLASVRLLTAGESNEWGETRLRLASDVPEPEESTFFPFFSSSVAVGLVPPFSDFFYEVLDHYGLQALHLHPNSVLLLSIFAYYCEAYLGVMPSVALLRHFFFLHFSREHTSGCANFVACGKANSISSTGKRADNIRSKWVMMDAQRVDPRLALPTEAPRQGKGWPKAELVDERASSVLGQMMTDLKPGNARAAKITGAMLLREFLMLRVAPLQARARPLWELEEGKQDPPEAGGPAWR